MLGINDMSLPLGGLFDIYHNWHPPHNSHRKGTSVDIDRCAWKDGGIEEGGVAAEDPCGLSLGYPGGFVRVDRKEIEKLCNQRGGRLLPEPTCHYEF